MRFEGYEQWQKMHQNMMMPLGDWNKASTEIWNRLTQQQLDVMSDNLLRLSHQLKRLSHVTKPEDFINLQKECLNEDITASIETMQKLIHSSTESMEEFTKLCDTCLHEQTKTTSKS